jgi:hypothetical protein
MTRSILAVLAMALLTAAPLTAQQELPNVLDSLAAIWERGDAGALARLGSSRGIDLEVYGESLGRVSGRKAAAALRLVFANQETIAVRANTNSRARQAENSAFAELTWDVRPRGSAMPARSTVFVGLVRENRDWQVSQIRVMR